jgi:hypothetical protein
VQAAGEGEGLKVWGGIDEHGAGVEDTTTTCVEWM